MSDLLNFDFGFTAVDENELEAVQSTIKTADSKTAELAVTEEIIVKIASFKVGPII